MYRLLIFSRKKATEDMFADMTQEDLGDFKAPHFRSDYYGALDCLSNHAIDAVAFDDEDEAFFQYLAAEKPDIPVFLIGKDKEEQKKILTELDCLLIKLNADNTNDDSYHRRRMEIERNRWVNRVLVGLETSREELIRHSYLYRYSRKVYAPLWFYQLSIPKDDDFISERWHYGSERLETALSNFFGREYLGMSLHIAVVSPEEVRLVCIPMNGTKLLPEEKMQHYIQATIDHVDEYLGLKMKVENLCQLPGIVAFAK